MYSTIAPSAYEKLHQRFLRISGGEGESAAEGTVSALLRPGAKVLDAGCGTGRLARKLLLNEPKLAITLLDQSPRLLAATRDIPARRVHGDMTALPFPDESFDLALAFWSIEATTNPRRAVAELTRVVRKGGSICTLFCAKTEQEDILDHLIAWGVRLRKAGRLLNAREIEEEMGRGAARVIRLSCRGPVGAYLARKGSH